MKRTLFQWLFGLLFFAAVSASGATIPGRVIATVEYFYSPDGVVTGRSVNGHLQRYEYDRKGQLLSVTSADTGRIVEHYVYDPAGNILSKTIGGKTTKYTYDAANQLVTSTVDGKITRYAYDAAGRLVKEGDKSYTYGYLDKVLEVQENGKQTAAFDYHMDGQIASVTRGEATEPFLWDKLALIHRGGNSYINEPYVTGGNPILSSKDGVMFNDMLGNTLGTKFADKFNPVAMTAFGETVDQSAFFTGKPAIGELGYAFLFRNYCPSQGKWQTSDPLGYPDGWNNFAYVNNWILNFVDVVGTTLTYVWSGWNVHKILGLDGELINSGTQGGYSVTVLWISTITCSCDNCKKSDVKTFYGATGYSRSPNATDGPVWTARSSQTITITADNILGALGVPTDALSMVQGLADKTIANNLQPGYVDNKAFAAKPPRPQNQPHLCE